MSFGQRFTVTPIQLITAISSVANNGILVKPRIVKSVKNTDTGLVTSIDTEEVRQVLSKETSQKMIDMLKSVVTDGTARYGAVPRIFNCSVKLELQSLILTILKMVMLFLMFLLHLLILLNLFV